jgi:biopolymer transport protein ExbD
MRKWPQRRRSKARIELIPMIDVMMFLLVFFVLISANVLPALGLRVALPLSGAPDHLPVMKRVTVTLAADGQTLLDGVSLPAEALPNRLQAMQIGGAKLEVIIAADRAATTQALVSVLDGLKSANVSAASIITKSK